MNTTQHPLVNRYLSDLARLLDRLPPGDRAEVLAGVQEHIEAGLAERGLATDADVAAVLTELGPPDAVAREAFESGQSDSGQYAVSWPSAAGAGVQGPPPRVRWSDRPWVPVAVGLLQVLGLVGMILVAVGTAVYSTFESSDGVRVVDYSAGSALVATVAGAVMVLPLWIGVALLAGNSSLWSGRQKILHLLLLPVSTLLIGLAPDLGWALAGERGLNVASGAALVVVLVAGGWLVVHLTRAGRRRAAGARAQS